MQNTGPFQQYFEWLQEGLKKIVVEGRDLYLFNLVDYRQCEKTQNIRLIIQVAGKNIYKSFYPSEIYSDRKFLSCFNPLDASRITELALLELAKSNFSQEQARSLKLVEGHYCSGEAKLVFRDQVDNTIINKTAKEVMNDKKLQSKILPDDLFKAGYLCGSSIMGTIRNKIKSWRSKNDRCKN